MAGTTTDKLERLMQTKADIKSALIEKGQAPGDVFSQYADMVRAISGGGGGTGSGNQFAETSFVGEPNFVIESTTDLLRATTSFMEAV